MTEVKDRVMECWQTLELRHVLTQERFRDGNFMSSSTIGNEYRGPYISISRMDADIRLAKVPKV